MSAPVERARFPSPIGEGRRRPVIKISIPWMLDIVATIDGLMQLTPESKYGEAFPITLRASGALETLFGQSVYAPYLRSSREKGNALYAEVERLIEDDKHDWDAPIKAASFRIRTLAEQFRLVFVSEISTLPVFIVQPKDNYDVTLLIERGSGLFPANMIAKVPESAFDAAEAGRALAFQLPTACGFHTFRAVESVLRRYWDTASGGKTRPEPQTIGKFAADMDAQKIGEVKVLEALKQLAKLHRNPCIHPDVVLTDEEAIGILGMSRSVIAAMLSFLPDASPPTTVASPSSGGPP